jgi:hypothetical protein
MSADQIDWTTHRRGSKDVLAYTVPWCHECETSWPCVEFVKDRCGHHNLSNGLPCECGHHDEKVVEDPEQEKVLTIGKREKAAR